MNTNENMKPAQITWTQITTGTRMSCGAREATVCDDVTLRFKVLNRGRWVTVTLDPSDTYTVELIAATRGYGVKTLRSVSDVYVDNLNEVIYSLCHGGL